MPDENRPKLTFAVTKRDVLRFMRYHHLQAPGIRLWTWNLYAAWILSPCYL